MTLRRSPERFFSGGPRDREPLQLWLRLTVWSTFWQWIRRCKIFFNFFAANCKLCAPPAEKKWRGPNTALLPAQFKRKLHKSKLPRCTQMSQRCRRKCVKRSIAAADRSHINCHRRSFKASRNAVCGQNVRENSGSVAQKQFISSQFTPRKDRDKCPSVNTDKRVTRPSKACRSESR